jgi:hypothetical protein
MNLPDEIWLTIVNFMRFEDILIFRINKKFNKMALDVVEKIEINLKKRPHKLFIIPRYKIIGKELYQMELLTHLKNSSFNDPVSDQQPHEANRGFGFTRKWIWIRGPFFRKKTEYICIFQEDHIYNLVQHLKKYEITMLSNYIDGLTLKLEDPKKESSCIIS